MVRAFFVDLGAGCAEGGRPDAVSFGKDLTRLVVVFVTRQGFLPGATGPFFMLASSGKMREMDRFSLSAEVCMLLPILYNEWDA